MKEPCLTIDLTNIKEVQSILRLKKKNEFIKRTSLSNNTRLLIKNNENKLNCDSKINKNKECKNLLTKRQKTETYGGKKIKQLKGQLIKLTNKPSQNIQSPPRSQYKSIHDPKNSIKNTQRSTCKNIGNRYSDEEQSIGCKMANHVLSLYPNPLKALEKTMSLIEKLNQLRNRLKKVLKICPNCINDLRSKLSALSNS